MANLLQEPFKDWVKKQIEVRQKSLGIYDNISEKDLKFYHTSTPFIRLASSVNLTETETIELAYITDDHKARLDALVSRGSSKEEALKVYYEERNKIIPTLTGREVIKKSNFTFPIKNSMIDKLLNSNPKLKREDIIGDSLAKNFILQGGSISVDGELQGGLTNGNIFNGAYGWGGISERGYVPMPGIESIQTQYQNNGALSTTTIKIKAFSREQFSLIDVLYMRPGYNLLLEFGHSVYLDNDGNLQTWNNLFTTPLSKFIEGNTDQYQLLDIIKKEREKFYGNYEAIFGKITKFKWDMNPDGSYSIEIKLTGNGDVIENLKINLQQDNIKIGQDKVTPSEEETESTEQQDPPLVADREKSSLNRFLYKLSNFTDGSSTKLVQFNSAINLEGNSSLYQSYNSIAGGIPLPPFDNFPRRQPDGKFIRKSEINTRVHVLQQFNVITDGGEKEVTQTFIQLIHLLAFIESDLMLYDGDTPLVRFDFNYYEPHKDENYMLTFPGQFSSDPRVCVIPLTNNNVNGLESIKMRPTPSETPPDYIEDKINYLSNFTTNENGGVLTDNNVYVGRIGGIFINANFIAETLANTERDEKGNISILDFLNTILQKICEVLGGVNQLKVTFDEDTGTIRFYEEIPQRFNNPITKDYSVLNVYGVSPNEGSFVKNINLNSELSNKFATQISIGAQAGGNELSDNASSFSTYNKGLEDRVIKTKTNKSSNTSGRTSSPKETLINNWGTPYSDGKVKETGMKVYIRGLSTDFAINNGFAGFSTTVKDPRLYYTSEYIDILNEYNKQYASVIVGSLQQENQIANFFLPFNLKINIKGLSGMVLYQQFSINTKILPATYDENGINYIIKGLNHSVTPQSWDTEVETTPISLPPSTPIILNPPTYNAGNSYQAKPTTLSIQPPLNNTDKFVIWDNITDGNKVQYEDTFNSEITIQTLVSRLHPKARPKFIQFFNELNSKYPGYTAKVNSIGRRLKVSQDFRKTIGPEQPFAGGSNHNYFMALDMNIILPSGEILRKSENLEGWISTGIPDIAKKYGIEWGNYKNYKDYVHFAVPFSLNEAKKQLSILYPDFNHNGYMKDSRLIEIDEETKKGNGIYKVNII